MGLNNLGNRLSDLFRHEEALAAAWPSERGYLLLNKAVTLGEQGDHEGSLAALAEAEQVIDGKRQPRLAFGVFFNRAANLLRLGRAEEAARWGGRARELALQLGNGLDLVKALWLEGNLLGALGRRTAAITALEQVCLAFEQRNLPFSRALACLDLALVYQKDGRLKDVQRLALEILSTFQALNVQRDAIAALDHAGATGTLARTRKLPIVGPHPADQFWIDALPQQSRMFGFPAAEPFTPTRWLHDGDTVNIGHCALQVRHCPGHTPGHMSYRVDLPESGTWLLAVDAADLALVEPGREASTGVVRLSPS